MCHQDNCYEQLLSIIQAVEGYARADWDDSETTKKHNPEAGGVGGNPGIGLQKHDSASVK